MIILTFIITPSPRNSKSVVIFWVSKDLALFLGHFGVMPIGTLSIEPVPHPFYQPWIRGGNTFAMLQCWQLSFIETPSIHIHVSVCHVLYIFSERISVSHGPCLGVCSMFCINNAFGWLEWHVPVLCEWMVLMKTKEDTSRVITFIFVPSFTLVSAPWIRIKGTVLSRRLVLYYTAGRK